MKSLLYGLAIGDALGVPVEFKSRSYLKENPVTDMIGYGTHNQPPGTWSDDASLSLCLAECIQEGFNIDRLADKFVKWRTEGYMTVDGAFDIGVTTDKAIHKLINGASPKDSGCNDEYSNGNGSLMRIAPLAYYVKEMDWDDRFQAVKDVSSITHAHIRSVLACFYLVEFLRFLFEKMTLSEVHGFMNAQFPNYLDGLNIDSSEKSHFDRILSTDFYSLLEDEIKSDGYVIHTLEASIWCLLTTDNYKDAVLKAVNLGYDSDTTGCVTGALAGLYYGLDSIPVEWINELRMRDPDLFDLGEN